MQLTCDDVSAWVASVDMYRVLLILTASAKRIAALATIPILYDGATGVCLQFHNTTDHTYVVNYTDSCYQTCDGIWSCSEMLCKLFRNPGVIWVGVRPNQNGIPCDIDVDAWLAKGFTAYDSFNNCIWWSWLLFFGLFLFYICGFVRYIFWPMDAFKPDLTICKKEFTNVKLFLVYIMLFLFRIPVYVAYGILMHQIKSEQVDKMPDPIENAEMMESYAFLGAFIIDNLYNPFEVAKLFFKNH